MDSKNNKKQVIIGVSVLLLVTLTLLGLTYAYYKTRLVTNTNEKSISVISKKLEVTYQNESALITADKISPGYTVSKTFEVKNTGDETVGYSIILDSVENEFSRTEDWTYSLKKILGEEETEIATGTINSENIQTIYERDTIAKEATNKYKLQITYIDSPDDQSEDMNKHLSLRINIGEEITIFTKAEEGTLLKAIGRNTKIEEPKTMPGREITTEEEAVFASTEDDYGTSYYYRGNVDNNFLNFGNMCWRIVRVQGDGSIKIILADESRPCNDENYKKTNQKVAFINNGQKVYYASTDRNFENVFLGNSLIPSVLSEWMTEKGLNDNKNIKEDAEWCSDLSIHSSSSGDIYLGAWGRLGNVQEANPSLKCNFKGTGDSVAKKYIGGVALITADELAFAGLVTYSSSEKSNASYIYNIEKDYWFSMSPYYKTSTGFVATYNVNAFYPRGGIDAGNTAAYLDGMVRPALVLKADTPIQEDGNGTQQHPYVVTN